MTNRCRIWTSGGQPVFSEKRGGMGFQEPSRAPYEFNHKIVHFDYSQVPPHPYFCYNRSGDLRPGGFLMRCWPPIFTVGPSGLVLLSLAFFLAALCWFVWFTSFSQVEQPS